jgi:hypothetical protein
MKRVTLLITTLVIATCINAQNCWIKDFGYGFSNPQQKGFVAVAGKYIVLLDKKVVCMNNSGNVEWSQDIDLFNPTKLDSTADGNIVLAGQRITGSAPANQYPPTIHMGALIKIGLDGKLLWEVNFPPDSMPLSSVESVTQTTNGRFLIGLSEYNQMGQGKYELMLLNANGTIQQRKLILPNYSHSITQSGNGYLLYNNNEVISLNQQLDTLWVHNKAHFGTSDIVSVKRTSPIGAIITGNVTVKVDDSGNVEWTDNNPSTDVHQVPNGYLVTGSVRDTTIHPLWFTRIRKLSSQGMEQWSLNVTMPFSLFSGPIYQGANNELVAIDGLARVIYKTNSTGACLTQPIDTIETVIGPKTSANLLRGNLANDGIVFLGKSGVDNGDLDGILYPANTPNPKNTLYSSALWLAGLDAGGNLHTAAQTYRQSGVDYLPYPISAQPQERYGWDHIWRITNQEVYAFRQDFNDNGQLNNTIPDAIKYWPAKYNSNARGANGTPINVNFDAAPFYDSNADGIYNVFDADYPLVYGDEMFWWVFTDSMPIVHGETEGAALGVEVNAMAYSFYGTPGNVLERTIFTRYEITNKSSNKYHDLFLGIFSDIEIGCYNDDYIGCDTIGEFYYGYNATDHDSCVTNTGQLFGFITNPPVQSVVFLSHPLDRFSLGFSSFSTIPNSVKYNYILQNKDENGSYVVNPITGSEEYHMFPGNPSEATEWSMASTNVPPHDSKGIGSSGPFTLQPNETITFEVAYVVHPKGDLTNSSNVTEMQAEVDELHGFHDGYHPVSIAEVQQKDWSFNIYPNPNSGSFSINIEGTATYEVYDLAGRKVEATILGQANGATISGLNAGTYIVKVTKLGQHKNQKVVVF